METLPLKIYPEMCDRQVNDLNDMLFALDDFGATVMSLTSQGAQAYSSFIDAREKIRKDFKTMFKHYRLVEA